MLRRTVLQRNLSRKWAACRSTSFRTTKTVQQRGLKKDSWRAPSVTNKQRSVSATEYHEANRASRDRLLPILEANNENLGATPEQLVEFLDRVFNGTGTTIDRFREAQPGLQITSHDLHSLARVLTVCGSAEHQRQGFALACLLSGAGFEKTTVWLMNEAVLQMKRNPRVLHSKQLAPAREHLRKLADRGHPLEAMMLEGTIAYELQGDDERARGYWERAIEPAVEHAKRVLGSTKQDAVQTSFDGKRGAKWDPTGYALASPWDELTLFHHERENALYRRGDKNWITERKLVEKYVNIGCEVDDPMSYFRRADFFKSRTEDGATVYTSAWLYDMTKAAASLHIQAAHHLAEFYSTSVWKYIDDEPPDYLKPTPFDSKPPSLDNGRSPDLLGFLKSLIGLAPPPEVIEEPSDAIFHAAVFPSTAVERWKLAKSWLEIPRKQKYAPSYLLAANLERQRWFYHDANAPAAALDMNTKRYDASPASAPEVSTTEQHNDAPEGCFENTLRDLDKAKAYIREVFYAAAAERLRTPNLSRREGGTLTRVHQSDDLSDFELEGSGVGPELLKWHRDWTVNNMYRGTIRDLATKAEQVCDEEGWDIYDDENSLLYHYNRRKHASLAE